MSGSKKTLPAIFLESAAVKGANKRPFSRWFRDESNEEGKTKWKTLMWDAAGAKVRQLATILQKEHGVLPNDRVLLLCDSGPESILFIYAVQICG
jgi:acyl-CoA synthetase (AMP-forming)/AMP-acid ligase II